MKHAHAIRRRVFIEEQHVPEEIEMDADDAHAFHALAILDGNPSDAAGWSTHGADEVKIGAWRCCRTIAHTGVGREILRFLMRSHAQRGFRKAILHAQTHGRRLLSEGRLHAGGRRLRRSRHRASQDGTPALANRLTGSQQTPRSRAQPLPASRGSRDDARWELSPAAHSDSTPAPALRPLPS